jgi:integrase
MRQNSRAAEAKIKNGRVIIRLPRNWFEGKQREFSLGIPGNLENLTYGRSIATQINHDHRSGQFDFSLAKYREQPLQQLAPEDFTLGQLWEKYCQYKKSGWKAKTVEYYAWLGHLIHQLPTDWANALDVRACLLELTTEGQAIRVLKSIESCLEWAMRVGLLADQRNPYRKMGADLQGRKSARSVANAFTQDEQSRMIQAFRNHPRWSVFGDFVEFLFLTGCRPSEAIGLHWEQIAPDCSTILFDRSVVKIGQKWHVNKLSKTNRERIFYCHDRLQNLIGSLVRQNSPVFLVNGQYINYDSFDKPWKKLSMEVTGKHSTPYSARDTFITHQTELGKPVAVVAQWVDNSSEMIEKKYLDTGAIRAIRPG